MLNGVNMIGGDARLWMCRADGGVVLSHTGARATQHRDDNAFHEHHRQDGIRQKKGAKEHILQGAVLYARRHDLLRVVPKRSLDAPFSSRSSTLVLRPRDIDGAHARITTRTMGKRAYFSTRATIAGYRKHALLVAYCAHA